MLKLLSAAAALALSATAANAQTQIVDLSAGPSNPNSGPYAQSVGIPLNPKTYSFGPGTYSVTLIDNTSNGGYAAYTVADGPGNFTEQFAGFLVNGASTTITTGNAPGRFTTAALALAAYQAAGPLFFNLLSTTDVSFFIEDNNYSDDTGGVSFAVTQISSAAPEPASWALMIVGFGAIGVVMRRRQKVAMRVSYAN